MKISAIIIAKNEEKKIDEAIKSVRQLADEILVVDTGSIDKTIEIAKKHGARVVNYAKGGFNDWRNKGAKEAKGDWLLYVDADEQVTPELKKEIQLLLTTHYREAASYAYSLFTAYDIPRKNYIFGQWFKHGGQWPDRVLRLIKKEALVEWVGELHEQPKFEGKMGSLKNAFVHQKHDNLEEMIDKTNNWSEVEAKLMFQAKHPKMNIPRFLSAMFREFWLRMIRQAAFLDGPKGIIYAFYQVFSRFVSYAKLWELQNESGNS